MLIDIWFMVIEFVLENKRILGRMVMQRFAKP